jgi:hypothetical protein
MHIVQRILLNVQLAMVAALQTAIVVYAVLYVDAMHHTDVVDGPCWASGGRCWVRTTYAVGMLSQLIVAALWRRVIPDEPPGCLPMAMTPLWVVAFVVSANTVTLVPRDMTPVEFVAAMLFVSFVVSLGLYSAVETCRDRPRQWPAYSHQPEQTYDEWRASLERAPGQDAPDTPSTRSGDAPGQDVEAT